MPSVKRLFSLLILSSLAVLAGCGSGGSHTNPTPPPSGGFNPGSLNGTYVFSTAGVDVSGNPMSITGTFSANGNRGITGGTISVSGAAVGGAVSNQAVGSNSSYILTADGRGQLQLTNSTPLRTITFDFVLTSNSHGLITEFDGNGTGSGTLDLQSAVTQAQLVGSFAFNISGADLGGNPLATVGSFPVDASGNISNGVQDFNGISNSVDAFTSLPLNGSLVLGAAGAPGTATLTTTGVLGIATFDVYPVDKTHLKFIETDSKAFLSGDVFTQQGAALPTTATTFVFTMAGGITAPIAVGGFMPIDGAGTVSGGSVDVNNGGNVASGSFSGSYAASGSVGGRTLFTVSGFSVVTQFVAYPTASAGLQILESDGTGLITGTAFAQSSPVPSLQASQGYAMGLSAFNLGVGVEEDDIAEFTTTSGGFNGLIDINDPNGNQVSGQRYNGTYTLDSPATGRGEFSSNQYNSGVFYAVDSSTLLFLNADNLGLVGTGVFQLQNPGAQPAMASQHTLVVPRPSARGNRGRHK